MTAVRVEHGGCVMPGIKRAFWGRWLGIAAGAHFLVPVRGRVERGIGAR